MREERDGRTREGEIKNQKTYTDTNKVIKGENERRTRQKDDSKQHLNACLIGVSDEN